MHERSPPGYRGSVNLPSRAQLTSVAEQSEAQRGGRRSILSRQSRDHADLDALRGIVGEAGVTSDDEQRLRRARGKSTPDMLPWRAGGRIDSPDAVVAPLVGLGGEGKAVPLGIVAVACSAAGAAVFFGVALPALHRSRLVEPDQVDAPQTPA